MAVAIQEGSDVADKKLGISWMVSQYARNGTEVIFAGVKSKIMIGTWQRE